MRDETMETLIALGVDSPEIAAYLDEADRQREMREERDWEEEDEAAS